MKENNCLKDNYFVSKQTNLLQQRLNDPRRRDKSIKMSTDEPQKYFIHYPMSSSSNVTNTYSPFENETLTGLDQLVDDTDKLNEADMMAGLQQSNSIESTVMLKAYKLPHKIETYRKH